MGALVVRAGDRVLADLHIGWQDRTRTRRWRPETQALGFSATKGLAAMVIHRLVDRGLLDYDEPVATYWPEFCAGQGRDHRPRAAQPSSRASTTFRPCARRRRPHGPPRDGKRLAAAAPRVPRAVPPTTRLPSAGSPRPGPGGHRQGHARPRPEPSLPSLSAQSASRLATRGALPAEMVGSLPPFLHPLSVSRRCRSSAASR